MLHVAVEFRFTYIKATLEILARRDPETDLKTLLPWNFKPA